jgi:hypothetical protein
MDDKPKERKTQRVECECGRVIWATQYNSHRTTDQHYRSMTKHSGIPYPVYGQTGQHGSPLSWDAYDLYPPI